MFLLLLDCGSLQLAEGGAALSCKAVQFKDRAHVEESIRRALLAVGRGDLRSTCGHLVQSGRLT